MKARRVVASIALLLGLIAPAQAGTLFYASTFRPLSPAQAIARSPLALRPALRLARPILFDVVCSSTPTTCGGSGGGGISGTLVSGRVVFADGAGSVTTDADMTFATDTLTATKIVGSTSITDSGLSAGRVTFAGTAGLLSDDADLTFATDTLTVTKIATTTFTGAPIVANDVVLNLGTTNGTAFPALQWNTTQTADTGMLLTGTTSNHWVIAERQDNSFDFAHAAATDPTLFIHSHNQSTTQWIGFNHDGTNGKLLSGTGSLDLVPGGTFRVLSADVTNGVGVRTALGLGWPDGGALDAFFTREAAATIQMGSDVNGAAVAQTFKAHDGITGSNIAGANLTVAGGRGTGTGAGGNLILQTSPAVASGTTAQTLETRGLVVGKQFTLADNTATTFLVETLGNDTGGGGTISYCVYAADATTAGLECGHVDFAGVDVTAGAGGEVCPNPTKQGTPLQALSGSTLAVTFAATTGTDLCNIRVTADTNIATPVELWIKYQVQSSGRALTPQ